MYYIKFKKYFLFIVFIIYSCQESKKNKNSSKLELSFSKVDKSYSKINFTNRITEVPQLNYFNFPYMYNGGGVAVGDVNNDGLQDIYFVANMTDNALYLNKGDFKFEDITAKSNLSGKDNLRWSNGVTMADVNNDGWLDIYICASGPFKTRRNLLYINNHDLTFTEKAKEFGLDDNGYSTQSVFFDYDRDGDLDMYLCSYAPTALEATNAYYAEKQQNPSEEERDKLYKNNGNNYFTDVTEVAGLKNFGLSLNISTSDFNNDGWYDIYVSNDFNSPDFYYINNGDGTFTDKLASAMNHTANFGMGTDAADINNDGFIDLLQLDMSNDNNKERKTNMSAMSPELFQEAVDMGLHHQYMKNNLQLNNGNGTFSDIADLASLSNTNWSWSVLMCDLNNNGWKDIFISNGMRRKVNDNDFNNLDRKLQEEGKINDKNRYLLIKEMPVVAHDNYAFVNKGDLTFKTIKGNWGLSHVGFSQGIAYVDLDNDGDLDMVMNNLDDVAGVYKNNAIDSFPNNHYLRLKLKGTLDNHFAIGAKVNVKIGESYQSQELIPTRGYLSSVEPMLHFGLGNNKKVDTLEVTWPNGNKQFLYNVKGNRTLEIVQEKEPKELLRNKKIESHTPLFVDITNNCGINYTHKENNFNDYIRETLLPHKMSQQGPALAVGDINGDNLDDFYVGGAKGYTGAFYIQLPDATFKQIISPVLEDDKNHEDVSSLFFDVDNDGDLDLYVVSGGNEEPASSKYYKDRLYINNGKGNFKKNSKALPPFLASGSKVRAADYDNDGDLDLFIGGRQIPGKYPFPATSYILQNNSTKEKISLQDITNQIAPVLKEIGMVTDANWADFDKDGKKDLILVGEWMPITLLKNDNGKFVDVTDSYGLGKQVGWWNSIATADMDNDGDLDFIAGNLGLNYKYKASNKSPFEIFSNDFDKNGTNDIVLGFYEQGNLFPLRGRSCTSSQMPYIKKKFPTYKAFSKATIMDILEQEDIKNAVHYKANTFASTYFRNERKRFVAVPLENHAQTSSINSMYINDFNDDGYKDIIAGGNLYESEIETPRNDASYGIYIKNKGGNNLNVVSPIKSGLNLRGEIREIVEIKLANQQNAFLVARNEESLKIYNYKKQ
ncbi:VCBS repeat-containing protein [Polaribacter cellanae]|uniref:VCBS repeat-containing protein n=1 Tax=Polaribacter cellanae TaxID=2818493 RepID=A0A975CTB6_9FLAO|nr:VCBS repeat-containing protein [Polaribacter cellanae]QTE23682.1 VCBS repeat-containing protein [Polaribacter cellanae]